MDLTIDSNLVPCIGRVGGEAQVNCKTAVSTHQLPQLDQLIRALQTRRMRVVSSLHCYSSVLLFYYSTVLNMAAQIIIHARSFYNLWQICLLIATCVLFDTETQTSLS